ncbi:MAG: peptide chain release factor N(5)-glutamine methyltransferase [Flavobacteriaceae bacterium]|jgi:release factor glutamine methyltransferase|nr:peptide chain release factor N(5)-glutamine methyltransferase [Flavobacteriaceae bacterium]
MKSLAQIREDFIRELSSQYSSKEIDIIFYTLAESYLHKDRFILRTELHELSEDSDIKLLLFQSALFQLISGVPYQYVVGSTEFYGCKISVAPEVLIPRPETEELVDWIVKDLQNKNEKITIMDICSGSGCIAIALAKNLPQATLFGLELSKKALELSRKNADINRVNVHFIQDDLLNPKYLNTESKLDILVSNPPYIGESEKEFMEERVWKHEPSEALFVPDENPLLFYKKIIDFAHINLKSSGKVYVEINQEFGEKTKELFQEHFNLVELRQDLSGNFRMIKADGLRL